jgi:hypothetical protein
MLENSGPWSQARSPSRGKTCMAQRNVKCLIPGTGKLIQHLGMQKVSFQGPEEFSDMGECDKNLWVLEKMSRYQQRDCLSLEMEFSNEKLKQKGFFHSVDRQRTALRGFQAGTPHPSLSAMIFLTTLTPLIYGRRKLMKLRPLPSRSLPGTSTKTAM